MNTQQPKLTDRKHLPDRRQALRSIAAMTAASVGCCGLGGCRSAPVTGRKQLIFVPEGQEISLGAKAFEETISSEPVSQNTALAALVQQVGNRVAAVSGRSDYQWEFKLIASETQNAFCLPGGKVAIYEGILPVCGTEAGLAVVMSHEIAHALARHGGERMTHNMATEGAKKVIDRLAGAYVPDKQQLLMQAYGVGTKYGVLLPYNRKQESEADEIGLSLMARAGYDPIVAPDFWNRFGAEKGAAETSEFFSTHPSDSRRAADLAALMNGAKATYQKATTRYGVGQTIT